MKKSIRRHRRSQAQIESLLKEQEVSDITVMQFCKIHQIHKATFYNWRKAYSLKGGNESSSFIPLHMSDVKSEAGLFAEIELTSNITVRLFQRVDASYFKPLM